MEKITKKEFIALHSKKKLSLIYSFFKTSKEEALKKLNYYPLVTIKEHAKEVSKVDVSNDSDITKTLIYKEGCFIFVESIIDNSKNNQCSMNNTEYHTIAYLIKE